MGHSGTTVTIICLFLVCSAGCEAPSASTEEVDNAVAALIERYEYEPLRTLLERDRLSDEALDRLRFHLLENDRVYQVISAHRPEIIRFEDWKAKLQSLPSEGPSLLVFLAGQELGFSNEKRDEAFADLLASPGATAMQAFQIVTCASPEFLLENRKNISKLALENSDKREAKGIVDVLDSTFAISFALEQKGHSDLADMPPAEFVKLACEYVAQASPDSLKRLAAVQSAVHGGSLPLDDYLDSLPQGAGALSDERRLLKWHARRNAGVLRDLFASEFITLDDIIACVVSEARRRQDGVNEYDMRNYYTNEAFGLLRLYMMDTTFPYLLKEREAMAAKYIAGPQTDVEAAAWLTLGARKAFVKANARGLAELALEHKTSPFGAIIARMLVATFNLGKEVGFPEDNAWPSPEDDVAPNAWLGTETDVENACRRVLELTDGVKK